jgi:hypothetical protein
MKLTEPPFATTSMRISLNDARVVRDGSNRLITISATTAESGRTRTLSAPTGIG